MKKLRDLALICLLLMQVIWIAVFVKGFYPGQEVEITNEIGKPYAILTIDYGEPPKRFQEGQFYVLKCVKIRGTKIDYGFCPIKRDNFYKDQ